jgi:hypothetical protein
VPEFVKPPRGWLYGVLLTIVVFWYSGVLWQGYKEGEASAKIGGGIVILLATVILAHQALTRDDYRITKWTRVSRVLLLIGVLISVFGSKF